VGSSIYALDYHVNKGKPFQVILKTRKEKPQGAPLLGQRSRLLYWREVLEGLSYALEPHLLQELDPLPFNDKNKKEKELF
jgi:hypothetical protein